MIGMSAIEAGEGQFGRPDSMSRAEESRVGVTRGAAAVVV